MSTAETEHEEIYLFEIVQPDAGYATFEAVYKRRAAGKLQDALDEITSGNFPITWDEVKSKCAPSDLDMCFAPDTEALVFVTLPGLDGGKGTVFGDKTVVDLDVKRKGSSRVIRSQKRHPKGATAHTICSFEIDLGPVVGEIGAMAGGHAIAQLPIMFDFVDLPDEVSPVFKDRHGTPLNEVGPLGHGGIHPRGGSSMILLA